MQCILLLWDMNFDQTHLVLYSLVSFHAAKHLAQSGLRCLKTFSITQTWPFAFSICWYTHLAIWTVAKTSNGSDAVTNRCLFNLQTAFLRWQFKECKLRAPSPARLRRIGCRAKPQVLNEFPQLVGQMCAFAAL